MHLELSMRRQGCTNQFTNSPIAGARIGQRRHISSTQNILEVLVNWYIHKDMCTPESGQILRDEPFVRWGPRCDFRKSSFLKDPDW